MSGSPIETAASHAVRRDEYLDFTWLPPLLWGIERKAPIVQASADGSRFTEPSQRPVWKPLFARFFLRPGARGRNQSWPTTALQSGSFDENSASRSTLRKRENSTCERAIAVAVAGVVVDDLDLHLLEQLDPSSGR